MDTATVLLRRQQKALAEQASKIRTAAEGRDLTADEVEGLAGIATETAALTRVINGIASTTSTAAGIAEHRTASRARGPPDSILRAPDVCPRPHLSLSPFIRRWIGRHPGVTGDILTVIGADRLIIGQAQRVQLAHVVLAAQRVQLGGGQQWERSVEVFVRHGLDQFVQRFFVQEFRLLRLRLGAASAARTRRHADSPSLIGATA
jgi:hypothetical protein